MFDDVPPSGIVDKSRSRRRSRALDNTAKPQLAIVHLENPLYRTVNRLVLSVGVRYIHLQGLSICEELSRAGYLVSRTSGRSDSSHKNI